MSHHKIRLFLLEIPILHQEHTCYAGYTCIEERQIVVTVKFYHQSFATSELK